MRVLPVTIIVLFAFAAFIALKSYNTAIENPQTIDSMVSELEADLSQLEPASGAEAKPEEKAAEKIEEKPKTDENGKKELPAYVKKERPEEKIPEFTKGAKDLLEQMATRRSELEQWKKDLDMRASMIDASSIKLDEKIAKLEELKLATQKLLDEYKIEDDKKLKSMIKVYENMKPKDAAGVFDKLEMPVLLEIVGQMSERRLSAILAKMNGEKAKEVTEKLMANRELTKM
jgi:flagellar motility protein MotE (MotC chaperone)